MPKLALTRRLVPTAAVLALGLTALAPAGLAQDAFDLSVPKPDEEAGAPADLECATEMLSGSGPSFTADRDDAEEAAISNWKEKAASFHPDADFDLAKDSNLSCAVQGLYSKCFADGIPCKPKGE